MTLGVPEARYERLLNELGCNRAFRRVLIASNGMAATKFIISTRRWMHLTCGDAHLIQIVGMATPDDIAANARHVSLADIIEEVPGGSNVNNYANVNLIISLAKKHGCDAIWPGWGHASENPALPRAAKEAGIAFVGPDEHAMFALGDKVASTLIAQTALVPCVSWSGSGLTLDVSAADGAAGGRLEVPADLFYQSCVHSAEEAVEVAERVGYPVMIKASEGGGGKGVRKALSKAAIAEMYRQVADEVKGSPIFLMRLCASARHIEIQLLCDAHGTVAVLSGRDCSMQRRFQKIIEEGPPRCVPPAVMAAMEKAGQRLASLVGYCNAGTVEFLFVEESKAFYFLELNPRLQVEHPVTEGVTGLNIPSLMLLVAMGARLERMPRAREFIVRESDSLDASYDPYAKIGARHTIAARITAENTLDGWKPTVGAISSISFQSLPDVWGYFSVDGTASAVHQFADSQFGHVFASGASREEATQSLLLALDTMSVRGEVRTNIKMVRALVDSDDFRANAVDTAWLDKIIASDAASTAAGGPSEPTIAICGALIKAWRHCQATDARICSEYIERSAAPPELLVQSLIEMKVDFVCNKVSYAVEVFRHAPAVFSVAANGSLVQAKLYPMPAAGTFLVACGERKLQVSVQDEPGGSLRLSIDGCVCVIEKERDPSVLSCAYTGKLTRFLCDDGAHVAKGSAYAEIEVMKMLCMLVATESGTLHIERPAGSFVESGEVIARMALDDPSLVERPRAFGDELGDVAPIIDDGLAGGGRSLSSVLGALGGRLDSIMAGYLDNEEEVLALVHEALHDPELVQRELAETLRKTRDLPRGLAAELAALAAGDLPLSPSATAASPAPSPSVVPSAPPLELGARALHLLKAHRGAAEEAAAAAGASADDVLHALAVFDAQVAPVWQFGLLHARGTLTRAQSLVEQLAHAFLKVESLFAKSHTMAALLSACESEPSKLVAAFLAHSQLERRSNTLISLIDIVSGTQHARAPSGAGGLDGADDSAEEAAARAAYLRPLAALDGVNYVKLQLRAKQLLGSMSDDMASHMTKTLFPALHKMAAGQLRAEEERALVRYLQAHMHVAQALLFKAYAEATSTLRKAVARTLVLLWYGHAHVSNISLKTFFRTGKEKSVVTWEYASDDAAPPPPINPETPSTPLTPGGGGGGGGGGHFGAAPPAAERACPPGREQGALIFFSSKEDMEAHFAWLCSCISGVEPSKTPRSRASTGAATGGMSRTLSSKGLAASASALALSAGASAGALPLAAGCGRTLHIIVMADVAVEHKWKPTSRRAAGGATASYDTYDDAGSAKYYAEFVRASSGALRSLDASHVAVTIPTPSRESALVEAAMSMIVTPTYNFAAAADFEESRATRHILPQFVQWLELDRLCAFELKHESLPVHPLVHVFVGTAKGQAQDRRLFVRTASLGSPADLLGSVGAQASSTRRRTLSSSEPLSPTLGTADYHPPPFAAEPPLTPQRAGGGGGGGAGGAGGGGLELGDERHALAVLKAVFDAARPALSASKAAHYSSVHVFLHYRPPLLLGVDRALGAFASALKTSEMKLPAAAGLLDLEVRLARAEVLQLLAAPRAAAYAIPPPAAALRVIARWSHVPTISVYQEVAPHDFDGAPTAPARLQLITSHPSGGEVGASLDGALAAQPYALLSVVDQRRQRCHKAGTTYCYDLLELFATAVKAEWEAAIAAGAVAAEQLPSALTASVELAIDASGKLRPLGAPREPAQNRVGMVAWRLLMRTPEYPEGREVVVIANDLSIENGTFGPKEDEVFKQASEYARALRVPRVYIGANSGARFGLSESVKSRFRIEWNDWNDPNKGIKYLYLTPKDREALGDTVVTEEVTVRVSRARRALQLGIAESGFESDDGSSLLPSHSVDELQHKLLAVIGAEEGLGVESLQGSGMIAAETAIANKDIFTIALSTSRNIGIGSYVLRLGQRIVQHRAAPIILTGHSALNKLLGNNVYESNLQLGGPEVMANNGVSHAIVESDLGGIVAIVKWLAYVAKTVDAPPAVLRTRDPVERDVVFCAQQGELYDPRHLIAGDGTRPGLFDVGSFTETLADWARTVVVGRARLGGIPVGVIATENRLVMKTVLADPANMTSREEKVAQAGQVWFPDSAYKTAQAIHDFNHGERLPLVILANWRGFSGGRKDMFEEVLKFGSYIVANLTEFKQPVFVYVPPHAEVRGGAWVVIDPMINPRVMEMYADESARGGVLEPAGIAEIKFRRPELVKAMHRLDPQLQWMRMNAAPGVVTKEDISAHEADLMPAYAPLGEAFADLHDRPARMLAKGVIRKVVPWKDARRHFYWRLKRRLAEMPLQHRAEARAPALGAKEVRAVVERALLRATNLIAADLADDVAVCACFDKLRDEAALHAEIDAAVDAAVAAAASEE